MKVDQPSALHFGDLEIMHLGNGFQVPLVQSSCRCEQATDGLDRVVPQFGGVRVPQDRTFIIEALVAQGPTEFGASLLVALKTVPRTSVVAHVSLSWRREV
jgi:hypothetical protein